MKVPLRIYYDIQNGQIIQITGNFIDKGLIEYESVEEQIPKYKNLSERNRETIDVLELPFGVYAQDFQEGRLIRINPESQELIFEYPNPENPDEPIIPDKPLSVEIQELKHENTLLKAQNKANADRADFHEEVLTEIILKINP